ncbi:MAG: hypothetical protein GY696_04395 [Gammaproteobacteria bacterium]|nr:hypothetical protein [Gammaproteobacteria bacterium]
MNCQTDALTDQAHTEAATLVVKRVAASLQLRPPSDDVQEATHASTKRL